MNNASTNSLINQARRRSFFSASLLIGITSVLLLVILVYPQITHTLETRSDLSKKKESVELLKEKIVQLDQTLIQPDYVANNDVVQVALPSTKPLLEVLTSLDQVKRASTVELFDLQTRPGLLASSSGLLIKKDQIAETMPLSFTIKGTFDQITQFMDLLEKVAPFTTISSFEIAGGGASAQNTENPDAPEIIQVSIETETFFFNPNVKRVATSPLPKLSQENTVVIAKLAEFMTIALPEQREITGGGSEDLFGVGSIEGL